MLKITIITSDEDIASQTIREQLLEHYDFIETSLNEKLSPKADCAPNCARNTNWKTEYVNHVYTYCPHDNLKFTLICVNLRMIWFDDYFTREELHGDLVVFASRHSSKTGKASLLCHTPGNWGENKYGGKKSAICKGSALLMHYFYTSIKEKVITQKLTEIYAVEQEVTHHGPTEFDMPIAFIELGSDETRWSDGVGGKIVADTIVETGIKLVENHYNPQTQELEKKNILSCVGFGGTHYMSNFQKFTEMGVGFSHVVPKYFVDSLTVDFVKSLKQRVLEPIDHFVVDWNSLNAAQKENLRQIFGTLNIPLIKRKAFGKLLQ